jgi:SAM-dependent methyltransferase
MSTPPTSAQHYVGTELELFRHAVHWKRYLARQLAPFVGGGVLEVGAGLGGTTGMLSHERVQAWTCLEPDPGMAAELKERIASGDLPRHCQAVHGVLGDLPPDRRFDTILYIDVLEHIADDRGELLRARDRLAPGGRLVVLSPAHQWLYSPFDAAIGHHRRYSKATLRSAVPPDLARVALRYLDSAGVLASAANRFFTRQSMPTPDQLRVWDSLLVPVSTVLDALTFHLLGKSILGVWRR